MNKKNILIYLGLGVIVLASFFVGLYNGLNSDPKPSEVAREVVPAEKITGEKVANKTAEQSVDYKEKEDEIRALLTSPSTNQSTEYLKDHVNDPKLLTINGIDDLYNMVPEVSMVKPLKLELSVYVLARYPEVREVSLNFASFVGSGETYSISVLCDAFDKPVEVEYKDGLFSFK